MIRPDFYAKRQDGARWFLFSYSRIATVCDAPSREEFELRLSTLGFALGGRRGTSPEGLCGYFDVMSDGGK